MEIEWSNRLEQVSADQIEFVQSLLMKLISQGQLQRLWCFVFNILKKKNNANFDRKTDTKKSVWRWLTCLRLILKGQRLRKKVHV